MLQLSELLTGDGSGHGMISTMFEGKRLPAIHHAEAKGFINRNCTKMMVQETN